MPEGPSVLRLDALGHAPGDRARGPEAPGPVTVTCLAPPAAALGLAPLGQRRRRRARPALRACIGGRETGRAGRRRSVDGSRFLGVAPDEAAVVVGHDLVALLAVHADAADV